jgi:hypothetical protein
LYWYRPTTSSSEPVHAFGVRRRKVLTLWLDWSASIQEKVKKS